MPARRKSKKNDGTRRVSISVPLDQYNQLVALARKNRISTARVVREAIERLLRDDQPLFHFPQS
jgi:predicted DNA-binding protein